MKLTYLILLFISLLSLCISSVQVKKDKLDGAVNVSLVVKDNRLPVLPVQHLKKQTKTTERNSI